MANARFQPKLELARIDLELSEITDQNKFDFGMDVHDTNTKAPFDFYSFRVWVQHQNIWVMLWLVMHWEGL